MSLHIYLYAKDSITETCICDKCQNSHPHTYTPQLFRGNLTHNLCQMADAVGLYKPLWRPEEIGITEAGHLIPILELGLTRLVGEKVLLLPLNPSNGWGSYEGLVRVVLEYLEACKQFPEALVRVDR